MWRTPVERSDDSAPAHPVRSANTKEVVVT